MAVGSGGKPSRCGDDADGDGASCGYRGDLGEGHEEEPADGGGGGGEE